MMNKKKNIIILLMGLLFIMLAPSTIYAYDFEGKDAWIKEYISTDEEAEVVGDYITLYADESLSEEQSYDLNRGDIIKIIQPLQLIDENSMMRVIVNDSEEGYIRISRFIEESMKKSDSLLFKGYKKYVNFVFGKDANTDKTLKIIVLCLLLIILDKYIDAILSRFCKVENSTSFVSKLKPIVAFIIVHIICSTINDVMYYETLNEGIGLIIRSGTWMYYILYASNILFIIKFTEMVFKLFIEYNVIVAAIKLVEIIVLSITISIFVFITGFIGIFLAIIFGSVFTILLAPRVEVIEHTTTTYVD